MYRSILFISLFLLFSCSLKEKQHAAQSVAKMWDASNCSVGSSMEADSKSETHKRITLTLENIKGVNDSYPKKHITSLSAYKFLEYLTPKEIEGYDGISVLLINKDEQFEKTYKIGDLIDASALLNLTDSVCRIFKTGNIQLSRNFFDAGSMPDSNFVQLQNVINEIETRFGKTNKVTVIGFEFGTIQDSNEPVLMVYAELSNASSYTNYKFFISRKLKKIIHVSINEA